MPDCPTVAQGASGSDEPTGDELGEDAGPLAATPTRRPTRGRLALITAPIVVLIVISNVGDALAPSLVDTHPLTLIAMNARNRNLVLVTNQLDAISYYGVAGLRLLLSDPLFFLLGYWYGGAAVEWMEKRTRTAGAYLRQLEQWFGKAAYPLIFVAPNNVICLFAGAAGVSLAGFFAVNIAGTVVRLYLIRRLGEAFSSPIDEVLGFVQDYRVPLLVLSVGIVVVMSLTELRRGEGELEAITHLEEDLAEAERGRATDETGDPHDRAEPDRGGEPSLRRGRASDPPGGS